MGLSNQRISSGGRRRAGVRRGGFALLICMFMIAITSMIVIGLFHSQSAQMTAIRNTLEYERCRYLAEAGIQDAVSRLGRNPSWTGSTGNVRFPRNSDGRYNATVTSTAPDTVLITSVGSLGDNRSTRQITYILPAGPP